MHRESNLNLNQAILVGVPYLFKLLVDALSTPMPLTLISGAGALVLGMSKF